MNTKKYKNILKCHKIIKIIFSTTILNMYKNKLETYLCNKIFFSSIKLYRCFL